jgi:hypothetical protein
VHFAYVDESGDKGVTGSKSYTLGCLLVDSARWTEVFDQVLLYRRFLKKQFGIPVRSEIKANYLLRNGGIFRELGLGDTARFAVYRGLLRLQEKLSLHAFGVVIRKQELFTRGAAEDPVDRAWTFLLQRFQKFASGAQSQILIVHDEGDTEFVRKVTRRERRIGSAGKHFGPGGLSTPARNIVEDPVPKRSEDSFLVQLADLNAFAAFRHTYPPPRDRGVVVPSAMWEQLGEARLAQVSQVRGGPRGLVIWP